VFRDGGDPFGVIERPVDGRRPGGVMGHEHDPVQAKTSDDGVEVDCLVLERVVLIRRLVRIAPAQEIEDDHAPFAEVRHEPVVEVMVVAIAVHEHDGGLITRLLEPMDAVRAALDAGSQESRHDRTDAACWALSSMVSDNCQPSPRNPARRGAG
jgi:hypothetical protein